MRRLMEGMVPEFEDLVKREICSQHEVKQLVRRREKAEYLLHRREPTREDFLNAAQLEMNLEALLKLRSKSEKKAKKEKKTQRRGGRRKRKTKKEQKGERGERGGERRRRTATFRVQKDACPEPNSPIREATRFCWCS